MERPHTITIYNSYAGKYYKKVLNNVYWYGTDSINISGKGIVESGNINIIIDGSNLNDYVSKEKYTGGTDTYTIQEGCRILFGEGPDITSLSEIPETFKQITVFGIDENLVGSSIDNILITGK